MGYIQSTTTLDVSGGTPPVEVFCKHPDGTWSVQVKLGAGESIVYLHGTHTELSAFAEAVEQAAQRIADTGETDAVSGFSQWADVA